MCVFIALDMAITIPPVNLRRNEQPVLRRLTPEEMTASMALLGSIQLPYCAPEDRIRQLYSQDLNHFEKGTFAICNDHLSYPNFVMHTSTASEVACAQPLHIPISQPLRSPPHKLSCLEPQLSGVDSWEFLQSPDLYMREVNLEPTELFQPVPTVEMPLHNHHDVNNTKLAYNASGVEDACFGLQTLSPNGLDWSSYMYHDSATAPPVLDYDSRRNLASGIEAIPAYPEQAFDTYDACVNVLHGEYGSDDELPRDYSAAEASIRQMPLWLARYKQQRIRTWQQGVRPVRADDYDGHWSYRHRSRRTRNRRRNRNTRVARGEEMSSEESNDRERRASV
jgi:hypothetical protein